MRKEQYFTVTEFETKGFYIEPQVENGFDWDSDDKYLEIVTTDCSEGGLVLISKLREALDEFEKIGANYVNINYHCDHNEVEVTGVSYRKSTEIEIKNYNDMLLLKKENDKKRAIDKLNAEIARIESL